MRLIHRMRALILALAALPALGQAAGMPTEAALASQARTLMLREHVNGLAVAIIDDAKVVQVAAFGHRKLDNNLPLTPDTVMYGASLTKTAFAYMVLQLVDEGRLKLDTSIAELLPHPLPTYRGYRDLAADPRWRALTPRILLTHSSGFANFRWLEHDKVLRLHFAPGSRYAYSGEGILLLQLILEEGLGLDVGKEMQTRVFDRFGMTRTGMTWRRAFRADLADGYTVSGAIVPHDERSTVRAAGSMDTTIADQARMWAGILRGEGLSPASRAELVRPQLAITAPHQFPTLTSDTGADNAGVGLSAGLGLVTFRDPSGPAWFKGGHDDSTGNIAICYETGRRCLVMLSNDVRAEKLYPDLARFILGDTAMSWKWEYDWWSP